MDEIKEKTYTVGEFIDYFNSLFISKTYCIVGEVSSLKKYPDFAFFTICDDDGSAKIDCYAWKNVIDNLGINLEVGMKIRLYGYPRIYKKNGGFSINAREITPEGE